MRIYKREEGMWARMPLAIVGGIVTVYAARTAMDWSSDAGRYIWGGIVFALFGGLTLYFAFFHQKTGELLIDTESEMRKVVWPTREEVRGSTIVVIATTFLMAICLYVMDLGLATFLQLIRLY